MHEQKKKLMIELLQSLHSDPTKQKKISYDELHQHDVLKDAIDFMKKKHLITVEETEQAIIITIDIDGEAYLAINVF
ncbi:hypothetical protein [Massilibacterium senegalense]|uniref:hypothetical protein n=1 Tax=Massilibacterium senegalense TaxID=1632858 RepID=UPI000780D107|nr:hypothetical protein [Massilibacterium senegalense]